MKLGNGQFSTRTIEGVATAKSPINWARVGGIARAAIVVCLGGILIGCGGGGGGGGGGGSQSTFNTSEFTANFGLATIGALTAYDNSGTGQGITVAVIDTGIDVDNGEFTGAIAAASTDIVTNNAANLQDVDGHGTFVSGIIAARKNVSLTHGVAFDSTILAIRADDVSGSRFSDGSLATAVDYAVANNADVINLAYPVNAHDRYM